MQKSRGVMLGNYGFEIVDVLVGLRYLSVRDERYMRMEKVDKHPNPRTRTMNYLR